MATLNMKCQQSLSPLAFSSIQNLHFSNRNPLSFWMYPTFISLWINVCHNVETLDFQNTQLPGSDLSAEAETFREFINQLSTYPALRHIKFTNRLLDPEQKDFIIQTLGEKAEILAP